MSLFRSLGIAGSAYRGVLPHVKRPQCWLPFLILAAAQFATLGLLVGFHRPVIANVGVPLIRLLGGERATHYPFLYLFLPNMYGKVILVLAALVASLMIAVATLYFARAQGFEAQGNLWRRTMRLAPTLIMVSLVPVLTIYGLGKLTTLVPSTAILGNSMVRWGLRGGMLLCVVLLNTFLAYTTAWVVLQGHRALPALRDSIRVTLRTFLPTLFVVALPVLLLYPLSYAAQRVDLFVTRLRPETIAALIATRIVGELLLGFLIVGAVTRLFLWRLEAR